MYWLLLGRWALSVPTPTCAAHAALQVLQALAQQAGAGRVELVQLDTASSASIQACVDGLKGKLGHLDVRQAGVGVG